MNKTLPKKYLQQINYFELSIADPHKSVLAFTKVMSHRLLLFPRLFLEDPPPNLAKWLQH